MRTSNSIKNSIVSIIMSLVTILFGFLFQKIFVRTFGTELLGLNGLYGNILSMLSIAELGFGSAITYHLYKPIRENDYKKINILINYYKVIYRIVAFVILSLGLIVTLFIPYIVGYTSIHNIRLLFVLSLFEIVSSYLLTYKRSILYADQKNYIINIIHIFYVIIFNILEILILIYFGNYILYLVIKIICRILENLVINYYVNNRYNYLCNCDEKLDKNILLDIKNKVKGLLFHNIGSSLVQGTDNILISKLFGIVTVGLYSNYFMIINALNGIFNQVFQSITSSVGSLLIEENSEKSYGVYKNILFINSLFYSVLSACIVSGISSFIILWMGRDFLLSDTVLIIIIFNFLIQGLRKTNSLFKNAAGIFYEDKYVPIIESIVNLVFSIILGFYFGLAGVFIGTIISSLVLNLYSYPIFIYKKLFKKSYKSYLYDNFKYHILGLLVICFSYILSKKIYFNNYYLTFITQVFAAFLTVIIMYYIIFRNSNEFLYLKNICIEFFRKKKKK